MNNKEILDKYLPSNVYDTQVRKDALEALDALTTKKPIVIKEIDNPASQYYLDIKYILWLKFKPKVI